MMKLNAAAPIFQAFRFRAMSVNRLPCARFALRVSMNQARVCHGSGNELPGTCRATSTCVHTSGSGVEWLHKGLLASAHLGGRAGMQPRGCYLLGFAYLALLGTGVPWWALAVYYAGPRPVGLAVALAATYVVAMLWISYACVGVRRKLAMTLLGVALPLLWWSRIGPRNDRDWQPEVSRLPLVEIRGEQMTVRDLREFSYRTESEFTPRSEEHT